MQSLLVPLPELMRSLLVPPPPPAIAPPWLLLQHLALPLLLMDPLQHGVFKPLVYLSGGEIRLRWAPVKGMCCHSAIS